MQQVFRKGFILSLIIFAFSQIVSAQTTPTPSPTPQTEVAKQQTNPLTPGKTTLEFYRLMREKKFNEAFALTIYKPALDGLTAEEFEDLRPDFESLASNIPVNVEATREEINGNAAIVFVRIKDIDDDNPTTYPVQLRRDATGWVVRGDDANEDEAIKREGKNYFFNLRIGRHHEDVETAFRDIIKAEFAFAATNGGRYGDLAELVRAGLITDDLLGTQSTGYKFRVTVSKDGKSYSGGAEPVRYGRTGRLSYSLKVNAFDKKDTGGKPYNP